MCNWFFKKYFILFLKDFIIHERHRERQIHRQREKQAPCRECDVELEPRSPGSQPDPRADAQPLSHPGAPPIFFFFLMAEMGHLALSVGRA